jgi:hypothetical protein
VCARELSAMGGISASGVEDGRADAGGRDDGPVAYSANSSILVPAGYRSVAGVLRCGALRCVVA